MAECLSTEFFQARVAATRDSGAEMNTRFHPIESAFTDGADEIDNPAQNHQNREAQHKQKFGSDQFSTQTKKRNWQRPILVPNRPGERRIFPEWTEGPCVLSPFRSAPSALSATW